MLLYRYYESQINYNNYQNNIKMPGIDIFKIAHFLDMRKDSGNLLFLFLTPHYHVWIKATCTS